MNKTTKKKDVKDSDLKLGVQIEPTRKTSINFSACDFVLSIINPSSQILPYSNKILVLNLEQESFSQTHSVIIVQSENTTECKYCFSKVLSIGSKIDDKNLTGKFIMYKKWSGISFKHGNELYCLISEEDIIAVVNSINP